MNYSYVKQYCNIKHYAVPITVLLMKIIELWTVIKI